MFNNEENAIQTSGKNVVLLSEESGPTVRYTAEASESQSTYATAGECNHATKEK